MDVSKGSVVHVKEMVRALREMGCQTTLVASGNPGDMGSRDFVCLTERPYPEGRVHRPVAMLGRLIRLFSLACCYLPSHAVIYARDYHVAVMCLLPKLALRKRLVYEINGLASEEWLMKGNTIFHRAVALIIRASEWLAAQKSDRLVVVTEGLRQYLVSNLGIEARKIGLIPNGVNTRVFYPMDDSGSLKGLRACLGIQNDEPVVLFAGNLAPWQGIDTLLDSIPIVLRDLPRVKFLIVGGGALHGHLWTRMRTMNLQKHVIFTGMIPYRQVPRYVNLADVCVSPFVKRRNNRIGVSPLKIYEYMACGKAVVGSRIAGLDFIEDRETGILVEPESAEALASGLVELLLDSRKTARMGRNGADLARQEFDWGKRARQVLRIVKDQKRVS